MSLRVGFWSQFYPIPPVESPVPFPFQTELIFTALHGMPAQTSYEKAVCPSVKRVICDETEVRCVQIFIPYERSFSLVFWEEEWLVGATPFHLKFWVKLTPLGSKIADFQSIFARRSWAVAPSKKVQLTLIGSRLYAFQWSYNSTTIHCFVYATGVDRR